MSISSKTKTLAIPFILGAIYGFKLGSAPTDLLFNVFVGIFLFLLAAFLVNLYE